MNYLNIHTDTLRSEEYLGAHPVERATWLNLMAWCASQENGGVIHGASEWGERKWLQLCGITKGEATLVSNLYQFDSKGNLSVNLYPIDKESEVKAKRETAKQNGKKGGRPKIKPTLDTLNNPDQTDVEKRKGREGKGKEGKKDIHQQADRSTIFPEKSLSKSIGEQKRIKVTSQMPIMSRIGKWLNRKEDTLWNVYEAKCLKQLNPTAEEMNLLETYYTTNKDDKPLRKSIETLLNNWSGEVDRARGSVRQTEANKPKFVTAL